MPRGRNKKVKTQDNGRKFKKKISALTTEGVTYVDYKDTELLAKFMSDRAKIRTRRVTGNDTQQQRAIARAIKNAREMGLLPYASRITTRGKGGRGRDRDDRRQRGNNRDQNEKTNESTPSKDAGTGASEPSAEEVTTS